MVKTSILKVQGIEVAIKKINNEDYICLTDMVRKEEGEDHIRNWMRNKNTIEFLGVWEQLNNPYFKGVEFDTFLKEAGFNRFNMTPRKWIDATNAIGIVSKSGRNGGTYAHKDIAFEFGAWISPVFRLYLIREFQRLKEIESNQYNLEWNVKRLLSKANYRIHTDAIDKYAIPKLSFSKKKEWIYSDEADLLNIIMFGCTAKQWRELNPKRAKKGENIRDIASINELAILSNLESINATLLKNGISRKERARILIDTVKEQRKVLDNMDIMKSIKKTSNTTYIETQQLLSSDNNSNFNTQKDKGNNYEDKN